METTVYPPIHIIRPALPPEPKGAALLGTASKQACKPAPERYGCAQTRAATLRLRLVARRAAQPHGTGVNGVAPGPL